MYSIKASDNYSNSDPNLLQFLQQLSLNVAIENSLQTNNVTFKNLHQFKTVLHEKMDAGTIKFFKKENNEK